VYKLNDRVFEVGARHWDRQLFDELIPLPEGTTYNAYIIKGSEKTVLIDTVDPAKSIELLENLKKLKLEKLDYVVANHAEQDHSGTLPIILEIFPASKLVTNKKCQEFLMDHLHIREDRFHVISDGDTLALGDGTLEFILAPWVHWPETMLTYLKEDKILFSCDLFGSHLATSGIFAKCGDLLYNSAKRYYAEIMMPFRANIVKHLERLKGYDIRIIAASHGPVYDKPAFIIDAYREWISDSVKNEVVLPYVSMHESTQKMVDFLISALIERDITVKPFRLTNADIGELAMALVDAATVVIGTPTVLTGAHPLAANAAYIANLLRPKTKFVSVIGSYGWGGKTVDQLKGMLTNLKAEILPPVLCKGLPKEADFQALYALAAAIQKKHAELGITGGK
jgi:flavorubredoxin